MYFNAMKTARGLTEAMEVASRHLEVVAYNKTEMVPFTEAALAASPGFPVLVDRYLEGAIEKAENRRLRKMRVKLIQSLPVGMHPRSR